MAILTIKTVKNVLNDFKTSLFIADSLETFKVNQYDFFEFLSSNPEYLKDYEKILNYNNIILEDRIAKQCYTGDGNSKILLEMIKANNKKKYVVKTELEIKSNINELSDEEIDEKIQEHLKLLDNKQ